MLGPVDEKKVLVDDEASSVTTDCVASTEDHEISPKKRNAEEMTSSEQRPIKILRRASSSAVSVGKCPPRDMKRLIVGKPYTVDRIARWGDKLAVFLSNPDDASDNGFFKPPEKYRDASFYAGGTVTLNRVGYSASRNRVAQQITIDSTNSPCRNGCSHNNDPDQGCCSASVMSAATPESKFRATIPVKSTNEIVIAAAKESSMPTQQDNSFAQLLRIQSLLMEMQRNATRPAATPAPWMATTMQRPQSSVVGLPWLNAPAATNPSLYSLLTAPQMPTMKFTNSAYGFPYSA